MYEIETEHCCRDISNNVWFDISEFDDNQASGIKAGVNKTPGMMKDEAGGKLIEVFVGL